MVRAPVEITLLRGRTEPEDAERAEVDDVLLVVVARELLEEGLLLAEGFEPDDGLLPVDGFAPVEVGDVLVFGAAGDSFVGGTFACATGSPPLDRL